MTSVPDDVLEVNSVAHPVRALSGFSDGLICMGRLLEAHKVEPIYLMADDIPDRSENIGSAGQGAKEMVISALSNLSEENGLVRYVAYDRLTPNVVALHNSHPKKNNLRIPDFFIRGAITQIDTSPFSKQNGGSVNIGQGILNEGKLNSFLGASGSDSNSITMSSVTLDMNMGLISNYQMLPGVTSSNSLSVMKRGSSTELTVSFSKLGGIYSLNENRAGALSTALRSLVEVGMIELLGKLYNVPYENCLAHLDGDSVARQKIRQEYDDMSIEERQAFVAKELERQGFLPKTDSHLVDGAPSADLQSAIATYRVRNGLFPNTQVDYRLFEKIYIQSKYGVNALVPGEGAGPLKRWLHVGAQE